MQQLLRADQLESAILPAHPLAVLGFPVAHSISPALHRAAIARMLSLGAGDLAGWDYLRLEVRPEELAIHLPKLHQLGFIGLNLTLPHKVLATTLVEFLDPLAARMGAVNTLRRTRSGFEGFNTDGYGFERGVEEDLGRSLRGSNLVLLGAGGAARAAAVQALAAGCDRLWVGNRSPDRLTELLATVRSAADGLPGGRLGIEGFLFQEPPRAFPEDALVVNCTPAGMAGSRDIPLDPRLFKGRPAVYDMVYKPSTTPLMLACQEAGLPCANGLSMLVHQAARALELWTGRAVPVDAMREAGRSASSSF